jgi:cytochrome P450
MIVKAWTNILQHLVFRLMCPIPYWKVFKTKGVLKFEKSLDFLRTTILTAIRERKFNENSSDLLSFFLRERDLGFELSDDKICDELLTFLVHFENI